MRHPGHITIEDFTYHLPEDKIAFHPLPERDASKLLIYKDGLICEDIFRNADKYLPENSLLIFNDTKVINARLRLKKNSGGNIEIFCLQPQDHINEYTAIMSKTSPVQWQCMVGGAAKWKDEALLKNFKINNLQGIIEGEFTAKLIDKLTDIYVIEFSWLPITLNFGEVLEAIGETPLPPYIKRVVSPDDAGRYQTIYAVNDGSVAAPTAGLHFSEEICKKLSAKNILSDHITLHVGAGTFKPVKAPTMQLHEMHGEWMEINISTIKSILYNTGPLIAVGTTSLRTLESLYWLGVKVILNPNIKKLELLQWEVYETSFNEISISPSDSMEALVKWMANNNLQNFFAKTHLLVMPGYKFKLVKGLFTNFHQPKSTLLLLIAAASGNDWKAIYNYALENYFRFLSYGDGSLIFMAE